VESALHVKHGHGDEGAEDRSVVHLLQVKTLLEAELPGRVLALGRHQLCIREATSAAERHRLVQKGRPNTPMTAGNRTYYLKSNFYNELIYLYLDRTLNLRIQATSSGCNLLFNTATVPTSVRLQLLRSSTPVLRPASDTTVSFPLVDADVENSGSYASATQKPVSSELM
jgi:hypothetical protein